MRGAICVYIYISIYICTCGGALFNKWLGSNDCTLTIHFREQNENEVEAL